MRGAALERLSAPSRLALLLSSYHHQQEAVPFVAAQAGRGFLLDVSRISERGFNDWRQLGDRPDGGPAYTDGFDIDQVWRNCGVVASLKLSLDDPTVRQRLGDLKLTVLRAPTREQYATYDLVSGYVGSAGEVIGETVTLRIDAASPASHNNGPLVSRTFATEFRSFKSANDSTEFRAARSSSEAVLTELLRRVEFTPQDLRTIATASEVSALRASAVLLIDDHALLARIAENDPSANVRFAAVGRIQAQELLYRIAMDQHEKLRIHYLASDRVTDASLSRKLASKSTDWLISRHHRERQP